MHAFLLVLLTSVLAAPFASAQTFASSLHFGAEGEVYAPVPIENATPDGDRLRIRSVELTAQAALDDAAPGFSTKLTLGGDDSSGDLTFNLREGFVNANIGAFDVRVGKFYLPVGLLNQTRRSAWGMISAPRAISLFFTDNGVVDTGADIAYTDGGFQVRAGVSNGYRFDSSITNTGTKPQTPTHFVRPSALFSLGESSLTLAADYLARVAFDGTSMRLAGLDVSWNPTTNDSWAWQGQLEAYHRFVQPAALALSEEIGGYLFAEKGLGASSLAGLRFDFYKMPSLKFANGDDRKNLTLALSPVYTYRGRDHLRVQLAYTYLRETRDGDATRAEQVFELRLVTEFGDIPKSRTPGRLTERDQSERDRSSL
jgi:hypothetical protein